MTWRLNRSRPPQQPELGSSPAPFIPRAADLPPMPDLLTGDVQGLPTVVTAMWPTTDVPEIHIRRSAICESKIIKLPTGSGARDWGASSAPNPERPQLVPRTFESSSFRAAQFIGKRSARVWACRVCTPLAKRMQKKVVEASQLLSSGHDTAHLQSLSSSHRSLVVALPPPIRLV